MTRRSAAAPASGDTPSAMLNQGWAAVTHGVWDTRTRGGPDAAGRHRCAGGAGSQRVDQGCDGHRERAEGGPGPARRHRERLEGALPWAGAVHVRPRAVPPLRERHRGGGAALRGGGTDAVLGGRLGPRRPVPGPGGHGGAPRRRPDDRRVAGRDRAAGAGLGRRRLDPGRALRHHRCPQGHPGLRDHDAPGRGLRARVAQARGDLRRRPRSSTCRGGTSPSTRWRCACPTWS